MEEATLVAVSLAFCTDSMRSLAPSANWLSPAAQSPAA